MNQIDFYVDPDGNVRDARSSTEEPPTASSNEAASLHSAEAPAAENVLGLGLIQFAGWMLLWAVGMIVWYSVFPSRDNAPSGSASSVRIPTIPKAPNFAERKELAIEKLRKLPVLSSEAKEEIVSDAVHSAYGAFRNSGRRNVELYPCQRQLAMVVCGPFGETERDLANKLLWDSVDAERSKGFSTDLNGKPLAAERSLPSFRNKNFYANMNEKLSLAAEVSLSFRYDFFYPPFTVEGTKQLLSQPTRVGEIVQIDPEWLSFPKPKR